MGGALADAPALTSMASRVIPEHDLLRAHCVALRVQVVALDGNDAMSVGLGALGAPSQAQLNGFKSRVLRAEAATAVRDLYATEWRTMAETSGDVPRASMLVLSGTTRGGASAASGTQHEAFVAYVVLAVAQQRGCASCTALGVFESALALVQSQAAIALPASVWLVTAGAHGGGAPWGAAGGGLWGLARAVRCEAAVSVTCVSAPASLALRHCASFTEPEVIPLRSACLVPRLVSANTLAAPSQAAQCAGGAHMVTGGTGGLGLLTARWLAQSFSCEPMTDLAQWCTRRVAWQQSGGRSWRAVQVHASRAATHPRWRT